MEGLRDFTANYTLGQSLNYSGLTYPRFTNENGVVLGSAANDLNYPLNLFVSSDDGYLSLERVLIPVDGELNCDAALEIATRTALLARSDDHQKVDIILLHVGPDRSFPRVVQPDAPHCNFIREFKTGDVVEEICAAATDAKVDLIVMTTQGSHGVFDALRGSTTQQVLRQADCPLLATPAN